MARNKHRKRSRPKAGINGKRPRVCALFGEEQPGTCAIVRVIMPYRFARNKGWTFDHVRHRDAWKAAKNGYPMGKYDIYVMPRLGDMEGEALGLIQNLQDAGKIVIWETDDDYTNEHRKVVAADALAVANKCDAITVSTRYLAGRYRDQNKHIFVLENCIDPAMWEPFHYKRKTDGLTIGLGGTPTHYDDWKIIARPMRDILDEFPDVTFIVMGYMPDYFKLLPPDRVEYVPPLYYTDYPMAVRQIDIGLAPLAEDEFNLSKSAIKVMEYWASVRDFHNGQTGGAAAIASDVPVYQRVIKDGHNGLLVPNTEEAWHTAIRQLVQKRALRTKLGVAGYKYVLKNRNIQRRAGEWIDTYRKIYRLLERRE